MPNNPTDDDRRRALNGQTLARNIAHDPTYSPETRQTARDILVRAHIVLKGGGQ